jgi:hypothetical protein
VDLHIHSSIRLHGVMLNFLSEGTTLLTYYTSRATQPAGSKPVQYRISSSVEKEIRIRTGKPSPGHRVSWTYSSDCESDGPTHPGKNPKHILVI